MLQRDWFQPISLASVWTSSQQLNFPLGLEMLQTEIPVRSLLREIS